MRDKRIYGAVAFCGLVVILSVVYFFFDPTEAKWMPRCIWKAVTATDCPGCGSQRMAHALMHGDFSGAWRANAYALCLLPVIVLMLWLEFFRERYPRLYRRIHSPAVVWILSASVFIWWVLRNLI